MKLRLRIALMILLVGLVATALFFEGLASHITALRSADDLSAQVLEQTSDRVEQQIAKLCTRAAAQADLTLRMLESGQLHADDFPGIIAFWQHLLAVNPDLTSMYIGIEAHGECTGVSRLRQGRFTVWETNPNTKTGRLDLREFWLKDYPKTPYAFDPATPGPDIRERPWYIGARKNQRPFWTETFQFLGVEQTRNVQGVTYAVPFYKPAGNLVAVVTVDIDLGGLSRFLKALPVGKAGFAFVVELRSDGTRRVIAHPGDQADTGNNQDAFDRVTTFLAQHSESADEKAARALRFERDGVAYLGRYRLLEGAQTPHWLICTVVPEADVMEGVYQNNRNAIILGVLILLLAVAIALFVSAQVARPLERIAKETQAIGLMEVEPRPVAHSLVLEVDRLAEATEDMKSSLRSFGKYVPADLVRSLLRSGQEAALGGENRIVTIYFSDIVSFTSIAEPMPPAQLVQHLGEYLSAMSQAVLETGGTVDKYIGDAIMAFWGAPQPHSAHAVAACTAALRSQQTLAGLRRKWQAEGKPPFFARIGLNTGEVVVGNIGSTARLNYTVIGDPVNLASRLEGLNKHYGTEILISESTYLAARDAIAARPIGWVSVKGKTSAVLVYELLALKSDADPSMAELIALSLSALDAYRDREWAKAIQLAEQVLKLKPGDGPAQRLTENCRACQTAPPDESWAGVQRMESK